MDRPARGELQPARAPAGAGDSAAFERIYREHGRAVHAVAVRTGGPALAEDITQETFLHLWRDPDRFDPTRGSIRTYLLTVARNLTIDRIRSQSARAARERRVMGAPRTPTSDPSESVLQREERALVIQALDRLSAERREAIVTAFYGEVSYREAAEILGASEGTTKSRIRMGLRQLHAELHGSEGRPIPDVELLPAP